ncbi:hypothetical protein [Bacillus massilinigeriensis]|uniref:hypothetical protein n=1 Tax=Bacillus massilionigeriensis TaxID=1805475 RepID=UPI00096ADF00|nr:hypothetical protein [Bacillus massilionigeriensis]
MKRSALRPGFVLHIFDEGHFLLIKLRNVFDSSNERRFSIYPTDFGLHSRDERLFSYFTTGFWPSFP